MTYYIPAPKQYKYSELEKLNETEFETVGSVKINLEDYNISDDYIYNNLLKFKNLREIIFEDILFDDDVTNIHNLYLQNMSFNSKIALLNKLSNIEVEFNCSRLLFTDNFITDNNLYYIYKNHMLFIKWNKEEHIPENITHLNVMNVNDQQVNFINNLPDNIEYLHLACLDYRCLKNITNLPITLKNLSITMLTNDFLFSYDKVDLSKLKIPFACKLEYDYILF